MNTLSKPTVTVYCEYYNFLNKKNGAGMGFITLYKNQLIALERAGISYTEDLSLDTDILQATAQGLRTLYLIQRYKRRGKKTIIYACGTAEELTGAFRFLGFLTPLYRMYLSYVYRSADRVICISEYTRDLMEKIYRVPRENLVCISSGVDIAKFVHDPSLRKKFREELRAPESELIVANVAMVLKKKGTETFAKLGARFPKTRFIWYGKVFKKFFAPHIPPRLDNVVFYGYVKNIIAAYSSADIFLFPSYEENQGISVLEAGAMGLPIVVRDIPVHSWLRSGENCLKAKTEEDFERCIERLAEDPALRERLGKAGRDLVLREHSLETVGKKLGELYHSLV